MQPSLSLYPYLFLTFYLNTWLQQIHDFLEDSTPITFANKTTNYAANTIKLQVEVRNWPFKSLQNSLSLVFGAQRSDSKSANGADCEKFEIAEDSNGNLNSYMFYVNGVVMYPLFSCFFLTLLFIIIWCETGMDSLSNMQCWTLQTV